MENEEILKQQIKESIKEIDNVIWDLYNIEKETGISIPRHKLVILMSKLILTKDQNGKYLITD